MCCDEHQKIGHADSEHEMCPLCRALAEVSRLRDDVTTLTEANRMGNNTIFVMSAKIEALREALRKYGKHQDSCYRKRAVEVSSKLEDYPCDCGLDQALGGDHAK